MSDTSNAIRDVKIQAWLAAKAQVAPIVENERLLRAEVTQMLFPSPIKGTQRFELGNGYKVKFVYGFDYKLGNKDLVKDGRKVPVVEQVEALLDEIEGLGNEGAALAQRIINWEPKLSVSEYEALDTDFPVQAKIKALIDAMLTIKPASPQLSFEEPK